MGVSEHRGSEAGLSRAEQWHIHRLIARCRKGLETVVDRELRPLRISAVEFAILDALSEARDNGRGSTTPTELATWVVRRHNSVVSCLVNMERAGLVVLQRKAPGRRTMEVEMTPRGGEVYLEGMKATSRVTEIMVTLTANQRQQLITLLEKLDQALVDSLHGIG